MLRERSAHSFAKRPAVDATRELHEFALNAAADCQGCVVGVQKSLAREQQIGTVDPRQSLS